MRLSACNAYTSCNGADLAIFLFATSTATVGQPQFSPLIFPLLHSWVKLTTKDVFEKPPLFRTSIYIALSLRLHFLLQRRRANKWGTIRHQTGFVGTGDAVLLVIGGREAIATTGRASKQRASLRRKRRAAIQRDRQVRSRLCDGGGAASPQPIIIVIRTNVVRMGMSELHYFLLLAYTYRSSSPGSPLAVLRHRLTF